MVGELDDICSSIHGLLSSQKRGLKYNDIVDKLKEKGSRATINKHLRDLEQKEYVVCKLVRTDRGRSTLYQWNPTPSKIFSYKPPYSLLLVKIGLELLEAPNKMVRHTMVYRFRNQLDDVQENFGMYIFGDVPRSWKELNPHIYEEEGNRSIELDQSNISVDENPLRKTISVRFNSPFYTGKEKTIRFDYDWEEMTSSWEYRKSENPPDLFEFELVYLANRAYKLAVYEIDPMMQAKRLSRNEPQGGDRDGKRFIKWQVESPQIGQAFRFEWRE